MKWIGRRESANIDDRRGRPMGRMAVGGGLGTVLLVILAIKHIAHRLPWRELSGTLLPAAGASLVLIAIGAKGWPALTLGSAIYAALLATLNPAKTALVWRSFLYQGRLRRQSSNDR